jgi:hypothetical protein
MMQEAKRAASGCVWKFWVSSNSDANSWLPILPLPPGFLGQVFRPLSRWERGRVREGRGPSVRGRCWGDHERRESPGDHGMGLADEAGDDLPGGLNRLYQAGVLAEKQGSMLGVACSTGGRHFSGDLRPLLPQLPFPPRPSLNQRIPPRAGHGARPDTPGNEIGDLRQVSIMAIASQDGLFEMRMERGLRRRQEARPQQHTRSP